MTCFSSALCYLFLCSTTYVTTVVALAIFSPRDSPIPYNEDPFNQPPEGYESAPLGTILRSRSISDVTFLHLNDYNIDAAHQLLYRTSDAFNNATVTTTTVLVPHNADTSKVLSYQTEYDSANTNCAPSVAFQEGSNLTSILPDAELLLMGVALNKGWIVVSSDYEGPNAAFTAGMMAGHGVLDSLRAVLNSADITGVQNDATVLMWGYSGGSLATGWAAQMAPSYAPDLNITAAALGGTVPNLLNVLYSVNGAPNAGLIIEGTVGLCNQYPELREYAYSAMLPEHVADFDSARTGCFIDVRLKYQNEDIFSYFKDPTGWINAPVAQNTLNENLMGNSTPSIPLYIYKALNDSVSPVNDTDLLVKNWCNRGVNIQYAQDEQASHRSLLLTGSSAAMAWLEDRMNGAPLSSDSCSTEQTASTLLSVDAVEVLGETVVGAFQALLGEEVGPDSDEWNLLMGETEMIGRGNSAVVANTASSTDDVPVDGVQKEMYDVV